MIKPLATLLICIFFHSITSAQTKKYTLIGTLKTDAEQLIPIKLNIEVNRNGTLSGSSVTNFYNEDKTESKIQGKLDLKSQRISFREVSNISTKSDARADEFCFIQVENLAWELEKDKTIFNGKFKGVFPDSSTCASGNIYLVSMDLLKKMVQDNVKIKEIHDSLIHSSKEADTIKTPVSQKNTTEPAQPALEPTLMHEALFTINWTSDVIKLNLWDSYKEDNDQVNIYVDDVLVHNAIKVKKRKRSFYFDLENDTCTLKIVAHNEGRTPPNTVNAQLIDEGKVQPLLTKLKKGEYVEVRIIKQQKR